MRLILALAILLLGCQKPNIPNSPELVRMQTQELNSLRDGDEVFFILHSQEFKPATTKLPDRFYVRGVIENSKFKPVGGVQGIGDLATSGRYGWLELQTKQFHPMESDIEAKLPFVVGYMTDHGFIPSVRTISNAP